MARNHDNLVGEVGNSMYHQVNNTGYATAVQTLMDMQILSKEDYERISRETKEASGNLLYDVVITRTEGMKFYQSMYICNSRIYAYVEDKKFNENKKAYETWIKECVSGTKFEYTIKVFSNQDEYIKKVNSVSSANDKTVKIDKHIVERILVTCV